MRGKHDATDNSVTATPQPTYTSSTVFPILARSVPMFSWMASIMAPNSAGVPMPCTSPESADADVASVDDAVGGWTDGGCVPSLPPQP